MPQHSRVLLHSEGPALWPAQRDEAAVLKLKATTPDGVWYGTYQGVPTAPGGTVFRRAWWRDRNRFDPDDRATQNLVVARYISWDTGLKDTEGSAYAAGVVGELLPDYRLLVRDVLRDKITFPDLPDVIAAQARRCSRDGKLRAVIIEDKASGTSAYQTLRATAEGWLAERLVPFMPHGDKETRAKQGALWCRQGCVSLPQPSTSTPWLLDFEDELFNFPGAAFADQVDAFSQLLIYLEHILAEGYHARTERPVAGAA